MKKNIRNIILATLLIFSSLVTFSCKEMTDSALKTGNGNGQSNLVYHGFTEPDAIKHIGKVIDIYNGKPKQVSNGRWVQGEENVFRTTGVTVRFEQKLIKYEPDLNPEIDAYFKTLKTGSRPIHDTKFYEKFFIDGLEYDSKNKYVEFASYTDIRNGKVVAYDMNLFTGNFLDPKDKDWYAQHVTFSPDMKEDIDRLVYIENGERAPKYKYPYAINQ